jgi:hypothetical protein
MVIKKVKSKKLRRIKMVGAKKGQVNSKLTAKTNNKADALKIGKGIAKNQKSELTFL